MFKTYFWHEQIWQSLMQARKKLPHSWLFMGSAGLGKYELALRLAHFLLCDHAQQDACGQCTACQLLAHNNHPDLYCLGVEEGMIKIESIRELVMELNYTPNQGKKRIAIINHAHLLNLSAANALLKTLEEPAESALLILLSDKPSFLPATIRSRCQKIIFSPPAADLARAWLRENLDEKVDADLLLSLAENAPLKALAWAAHLPARAQLLQDLLAWSYGTITFTQFITNCRTYSWDFIVVNLFSLIVDLLKLHQGASLLINQDQRDFLLCFKIAPARLLAYSERLLELSKFMNENINLNQQLLLENVWLSWEEMVRSEC